MTTIFGQRVVAGAEVFNDPTTRPEGAIYWNIDAFEGWYETPGLNVYSNELGGSRDGEAMSAFTPLRARHMLLEGYVLAETAAAAHTLYDRIVREAFPRNKLITLVRYEPGSPKFVYARREGAIDPDWSAVENGFRFQIPLVAPDPLKYSVDAAEVGAGVATSTLYTRSYPRVYPLVYSTSVRGDQATYAAVINAGTTPSRNFTIEVFGPARRGAWRLTNEANDGELMLDVGAGSTDTLLIDFKNETVRLNGYLLTVNVRGDFFALEPGENRIKLYSAFDINTSFSIRYYSAWE